MTAANGRGGLVRRKLPAWIQWGRLTAGFTRLGMPQLEQRVVCVTSDHGSAWQMVKAGIGISSSMHVVAARDPSVSGVLSEVQPGRFPVWLVTHRGLGAPMFDRLKATGQISREALLDPNSPGNRMGRQRYEAMMKATPAVSWLASTDNSRRAQLDSGRTYMRVALAATGLGLSLHPVSQALQEFPEMSTLRKDVHRILRVDEPGSLQMLCRLGYGPAVEPSPRRPLRALLLSACPQTKTSSS